MMPPSRYRIRVSSAAADNMVFPGATHGFVTSLSANLRVRLGQLSGAPDSCRVLLPGDEGEVDLLLVVMSPSWLQDAKARADLEAFASDREDVQDRILLVELSPLPLEDRPPLLAPLKANRFWRTKNDMTMVLGVQTPLSHPDYRDEIEDLSREAIERTERLGQASPTGGMHVFLCHNTRDKAAIKIIAERLRAEGLTPWLDEWELRPGHPWQMNLESKLDTSGAALICIGPAGIGSWQEREIKVLIDLAAQHNIPVIPVILERGPEVTALPASLLELQIVDFRKDTPDPWDALVWGLTGEKVDHRPRILLAEVPDDMDSRRSAVARTLDQAGYQVVPKRWYPRGLQEFQDAVDRDLVDAVAFVQLLGQTPCRRVQGTDRSYSTLQYDRALASGRPVLQWRDPILDLDQIPDPEHRALVNGPKVRAMNFEEFKRSILSAAEEAQRQRKILETREERKDGDDGGFVFINASPGDVSMAEHLADLLSERGHICEWTTEDDMDDVEFIRDNITSSDGLIIVWGEDKRWVRRQGKEVRALWSKVKGRLKSFAVVKAPPPKENTSLGMSIPKMQIIDCRDGLEMSRLREFVESLEQGGDA